MRIRNLLAALILTFTLLALRSDAQTRTAMNYLGAYAGGTTYQKGDSVASAGATYVSIISNNTGNTPLSSPSDWAPLGSSASGGTTLTNNMLLTDPTTANFISDGPSEDVSIRGGGVPFLTAALLGIPSGNQSIIAVGSMALADGFSCVTACNSVPSNGIYPRPFPWGITNTTKVRDALGGANDLSGMASPPNTLDQSYYFGGMKARKLEQGIPDALKITAANTTYCTPTGSWTASGGLYPAGSLTTTSTGASITCTGLNATDAGFISSVVTTSSSTFTVSATVAGVTTNAIDPYSLSATFSGNMPYASPVGGATSNIFAATASGLAGGNASITYTCTLASPSCTVVGPVFLNTNSDLQNSPALVHQLSARWATGASSDHTDAQANILNNITKAVVAELRGNGINITWIDPNATPNGANQNSVLDMGQILQFNVTSGGSGFTSGAVGVNITGCTTAPTVLPNVVTVSGGALVTGAYLVTTSGTCPSGSGLGITFTAGTGAAGTVTWDDDFVHPNDAGAAKMAALNVKAFNSASTPADKYIPGASSSASTNPGGPFNASQTITGNGNVVIFQQNATRADVAVDCRVTYPDPAFTARLAVAAFEFTGLVDGSVGGAPNSIFTPLGHYEFTPSSPTFGTPYVTWNSGTANLQVVFPIQNYVSGTEVLNVSCTTDGYSSGLTILPGGSASGTTESLVSFVWTPGTTWGAGGAGGAGPFIGITSMTAASQNVVIALLTDTGDGDFSISCNVSATGPGLPYLAAASFTLNTFVNTGGGALPAHGVFTPVGHYELNTGSIVFGTPYISGDTATYIELVIPINNPSATTLNLRASCLTNGSTGYTTAVLPGSGVTGSTGSLNSFTW